MSPGPIGRITALFFTALTLAGGCRSSTLTVGQADASIEQDLVRGVAQIRVVHDRKKLRTDLARVLSRLREAHGTAPGTRRGRDLAIQGFEATLRGIRSQLDFIDNDSGEVAAATRDAARADRYFRRGANRLRAAGQTAGRRLSSRSLEASRVVLVVE